jgi:hypothetical protein
VPRALGGASTIDNVRLTCRPHNQLAARQVFGDAVMDSYVRRPTPGTRVPLVREPGPAGHRVDSRLDLLAAHPPASA